MIAIALLSRTGTAAPDPKVAELLKQGPDALLQEADRRHNAHDDEIVATKMTLHGGSDEGKVLEMTTIRKGENRRAIRFDAPADVKGMGVLITSESEMHVYVPSLGKVRRVASHAKRQGFMATDFSYDDMGLVDFSTLYSAKLLGEDDKVVKLELTRREGKDIMYDKLVVHIDKADIVVPFIEYYENGKMLKTQTRSGLQKGADGELYYTKLLIKDASNGHSTEVDVKSFKINQNVSDKIFSKRWLVRGN